MARSKGDGERLSLSRIYQYEVRNSADDWREVEGKAGISLTPETREKIHLVTASYSNFGPLYSPKRSVLSKEARVAIKSWLSATERLTKAIIPTDMDLGVFNALIEKQGFSQMSTLTPIGRVAFVGLFAEAVSQNALVALSEGNRNGRIEQDQWAAWSCLVTRELRAAGLKISGNSLDRSSSESPFIMVMLALQSWLPGECRHYGSYESMRQGVQAANRKFGRLREKSLLQIIVGWGSQLLSNYPGDLRRAPNETLASFDDFARRNLEQAMPRAAGVATVEFSNGSSSPTEEFQERESEG